MSVAGPSTKPVQAYYCSVCTLPTEYCEFGPSVSKCKTTLEEADKAEFERIWGEGRCRGGEAVAASSDSGYRC